jgi:hypothetical protein
VAILINLLAVSRKREEEELLFWVTIPLFYVLRTFTLLCPCTYPTYTAPDSRSFGLRSSYEIDILEEDFQENSSPTAVDLYQV